MRSASLYRRRPLCEASFLLHSDPSLNASLAAATALSTSAYHIHIHIISMIELEWTLIVKKFKFWEFYCCLLGPSDYKMKKIHELWI